MTDPIVFFLANFLILFMFGGLLVLWIVDGRIKKEVALHALVASVFSWVLGQMAKGLFPTARPFMVNGHIPLTILDHNDGSFPSSHMAVAFALALTIWRHDKNLGAVYILAAIGVGAGRVIGNVHYPQDILGGAILGAVVALLVERIHPRA